MRSLIVLIGFLLFSSCSKVQMEATSIAPLDKDFYEPIELEEKSENEMLGPGSYMSYVADPANGLCVNKQLNKFEFSVLYKPVEYVALLNLSTEELVKENYSKEVNDLKDMQYYTIKISCKDHNGELLKYDLKSMEDYEARVNYFSFKMQNDIKLMEGKDTLDCALFHFERNYGIAPNLNFVLAFPKTKDAKLAYSKTISINDRVFNNGLVNMTIKKEDINAIPGLKLN